MAQRRAGNDRAGFVQESSERKSADLSQNVLQQRSKMNGEPTGTEVNEQ